jgi:hypothetical protein
VLLLMLDVLWLLLFDVLLLLLFDVLFLLLFDVLLLLLYDVLLFFDVKNLTFPAKRLKIASKIEELFNL